MKIGIYDPYLDDLGGGEKYMMTIASCLLKDHVVDIFWENAEDVKKVEERFSLDLRKAHIVQNIFSTTVSPYKRFRQTKKYDVIFVLSDGSIPFVGSKGLFIHIQQPLQKLQNRSLFDRLKLSRVSAFFCNSEYTRKFLESKFGIHPIVVYPPVEFFPKRLKKERVILHVGRFRSVNGTDYKKQSVMIQAFKEMVDKGFLGWKFIVASSVHEKDMGTFEKMKQSAKGYPIEFFINKSNDALWDLYNKSKIYWHASGYGEDLQKHPELAEHFGISTVEAMAAGAVPVVINAGGQKEIVAEGESGLLWDTLGELKEKTMLLTKDETLWKRLSKNAQESSKRFSKERFCDGINKLVKRA